MKKRARASAQANIFKKITKMEQIMEKNIIKEFHDNAGKTYKHLANTVNLILRNDLNSYYRICKSTLENYANGTTTPSVKDIIKAIAKMCNTTPEKLIQNLKDYKAQKRRKVA